MSLFLYWGQEDFYIEKEIEKLKSKLLDSSFISMNYKVLDDPQFIDVVECCQTTPLMFGNMVIAINMEKFLIGTKTAVDDKQIAVFEEAVKNLPEAVNVILVCKIKRDENKKVDSRKKLYKIISKYAQVKEFPQYRTYQKELPSAIQNLAKEKELSIDAQSAQYIVNQLGANLRLIDSELEKLKIAIYPNKKPSQNDIKNNCISSDDIFALADLIVEGNKNEILRQFHSLTDRRHYLEILAVLQSNIQRFVFIKNYSKKASPAEIGAQLKLHEFVVKKTVEKLSHVSLKRLVDIKSNLTQAEYKIKSGQTTDAMVAMELALLE
ncbi:MAG: DNA polymerase III subunit delta [Candidatus Gastranaerophilales bacterium]|nr:DNA polymerase III subunit delta [Candidatus Gastranaerophilales bacterium]